MKDIRTKFAQENVKFCIERTGSMMPAEYKFVMSLTSIVKKRQLTSEEYNKLQVISNDIGKS